MLGTDAVALACILGGATVGGAATLAMLDGDARVDPACAVGVAEAIPRVVMSLGEGEAIVVAPRVRVHAHHRCEHAAVDHEVRIQIEEAQRRMERARERVERTRGRMERADRERLERVGRELERRAWTLGGIDQELEREIEQRLQAEMKRLEEHLQRLSQEIER